MLVGLDESGQRLHQVGPLQRRVESPQRRADTPVGGHVNELSRLASRAAEALSLEQFRREGAAQRRGRGEISCLAIACPWERGRQSAAVWCQFYHTDNQVSRAR